MTPVMKTLNDNGRLNGKNNVAVGCSGWVGLGSDVGDRDGVTTNAASGQTVATYIGPNNGNWSVPANWDIGVVPINNGSTRTT